MKDFEFIIVNDCSTDSTPQILKKMADKFPQLIVLNNEKNMKYGETIFKGIKCASKDYLLWTDSDYSHYPQDFWKLWEHRENYDAVWGIRRKTQRDSIKRTFFTIGNIMIVAILFQKILRDPNAAFKLFKREKILRIINSLNAHPFITTTKIAVKARQMKLSVKEIPVAFLRRSRGRGFKHIPAAFCSLKEIIKFRFTGK